MDYANQLPFDYQKYIVAETKTPELEAVVQIPVKQTQCDKAKAHLRKKITKLERQLEQLNVSNSSK